MSRRPQVLLLPLEFMTWPRARAWSYGAQFALEEGVRASGAEVTVLPAFNEIPAGHPGSWLTRIDHWCRGRRFDQIWLWPCLTKYDQALLAWAADRAPVRIGLITESLSFTADERAARPDFAQYRSDVAAQLPYLTHACAVDEQDVPWLQRRGVPACWWPAAVPGRVLMTHRPRSLRSPASFMGNPYGERARWLADRRLRGLLRHAAPVDVPGLSRRFEQLHSRAMLALLRNEVRRSDCQAYVAEWRTLRAGLFNRYARAVANCSAVVGLPGHVKTYAGRVVEAMAVGRPVVTAALPDRPRTAALFRDGEEILLYNPVAPEELAARLRWLQKRPDAGRAIAERALRIVAANHTIEARIAQVGAWMRSGREPDFRSTGERGRSQRQRVRPASESTVKRALAHVAPVQFPIVAGTSATTRIDDLVVTIGNWPELRDCLRRLDPRRSVVCWGAGLKGRAVHSILKGAGLQVSAFIDAASQRHGTEWDGLPVRPPQSLVATRADKPFVVVTSLYSQQIARALRASGYRLRRDWMVAAG